MFPRARAIYLADGDSFQFTMPGKLLDGRVTIAEERVANLEKRLAGWALRVSSYEQTIRDMAAETDLNAILGIAYRSGALNEEGYEHQG